MSAGDDTEGRLYTGVYGARYRVTRRAWHGPDFSRVCWVFPGQGSAAPGMFAREFREVGAFRERLGEADALARGRGLPAISDFIMDRAIPDSELPLVRLLALFTVEIAVAEYLWSRGHRPEVATAFSFGEIAAFTAFGVVSFASAFDLICEREACCPPPHSLGGLLAASATPEALHAALGSIEFHPAIFSTPKQTVVALSNADMAAAQKRLRQVRIATRVLKDVAQPHHSPWMEESAARLRSRLARAVQPLGELRVPFFSSVLRRLLPAGPVAWDVFASTVAEGLVERVDFVGQIRAIRALGCCGYREIGPGEVCSRFIEEILPAEDRRLQPLARTLPSGERPRPAAVMELTAEGSRLLGGLARVIGRITGYEPASISVESRFQEDLGIDSIKKADIIFNVVRDARLPEGADANVSGIRTVADAVRFLEHARTAPEAAASAPAAPIEFLRQVWRWREEPLDEAECGSGPAQVLPWSELVGGAAPGAEAFLAGLGPAGGTLAIVDEGEVAGEAQEQLARATRWLRDHVARFRGARLDFALVLHGASAWPVRACAALVKSLVRESPALACRIVHFDVWPGRERALALALAEFAADGSSEVRYENGVRQSGELADAALPPVGSATGLGASPVALAFGGARGITFALLRALTPLEIGELHVAGRRPASDPEVAGALRELASGGRVVEYHVVDACDGAAVERVFAAVVARAGPIDLVINGAGIERSIVLAQKTEVEIAHELAGKLAPALAICAACRRWPPRRLIHFSSLAARFGNAGQTVYALASQAVDEVARDFAREVPRCAVSSLHWPGWDGVGMAAGPGVREVLAQSGMALLAVAQGVALFRAELRGAAGGGDVVVDYVPQRAAWGLELGLRDWRDLAPLLGVRQGLAGFIRSLGLGRDAFLRDHALDGRAYLPAAYAVAMCRAVASGCGFAGPLENFEMHAPLAVGDASVTLMLQVQLGAASRPRFIGRTTASHFTCEVGEAGSETPGRVAPRAWRERIDLARLYQPEAFFHGPVFQVLHEAGVDETGATASGMQCARLLPVVGLGHWDWLVQAVDGCFQLLGLDGWRRHGVKALPIGIDSIWFSDTKRRPEGAVSLSAGASRLEGEVLMGDVRVSDARGAPLLAARGIRLRVLRRGAAPLPLQAPPA